VASNIWQNILKDISSRYLHEANSSLAAAPAAVPQFIKKVVIADGPNNKFRWRLGSREQWQEPDYDFEVIDKAVSTDSYLRRTVDKYEDLMWKNGYKIKTTDPKIYEYLKTRMTLHTYATGQPFDEFLRQLSRELIKYHNVLIFRKKFDLAEIGPLGKKVARQIEPLDNGEYPVGGYEIIPIKNVTVDKDEKNNIKRWQQTVPNYTPKIYQAGEVIHIKKACEAGHFWGDPFLRPVLDDIKAYRQLEEDAIVISHQMIEPKLVYKAGNIAMPSTIIDLDEDSMSRIAGELRFMLDSGAIVIPGHHDVDVLDTKNAQDITPYMDRLKLRVFGGLNMSGVHFGEAGSANRSVTDRLDIQLYDSIKSYQTTIELYITHFIINEWLMEADFEIDFSQQDGTSWAAMQFEEIDTDSLIKKQNHSLALWVQDGINHPELRRALGRLPLEDEDAKELYSDKIGAIGAKYATMVSEAAAQKTAGGQGQGSNSKTKVKKTSSVENMKLNESADYIDEWYWLRNELLTYIDSNVLPGGQSIFKSSSVESVMAYSLSHIQEHIINSSSSSLSAGIVTAINQAIMAGYKAPSILDASKLRGYGLTIENEVKKPLRELSTIMLERLERDINMAPDDKIMLYASNAIDIYESRLKAIEKSVKNASYNYGVLVMASELKIAKVLKQGTKDCELCNEEFLDVEYKTLEDIPPYSTHPNCECKLKIV
jgi:cytochrome c551/c552